MPDLAPLMNYTYTLVEIGPKLAYTLQCVSAAAGVTAAAVALAFWRRK